MLTSANLPDHVDVFTIEHTEHPPGAEAARHVVEIAPEFWVSPEQMRKAAETGSIWQARWISPEPPQAHIHAAADFDALAAAIAIPADSGKSPS